MSQTPVQREENSETRTHPTVNGQLNSAHRELEKN